MDTTRLSPVVAERIGPFYVYVLRDPRNGYPFYVGKGTGARLVAHGGAPEELSDPDAASESPRKRIAQMRAAGYEPIIDVIRHGIESADLALWIEGALIDTLPGLLNAIGGQTDGKGRSSLEELSMRYGAVPLSGTVGSPALLIRLSDWVPETDPLIPDKRGHGYFVGMSAHDLYNSTRAWWDVSPRSVAARGIRHVVAVRSGVTRAVFRIDRELAAGAKWGFEGIQVTGGPIFDEYVGSLGKRVTFRRGAANPVMYWPPPGG